MPIGTIDTYKSTEGWKDFLYIEEKKNDEQTQKCEKPTISYVGGKLTFSCETEDAMCQYSISDSDIKSGRGTEVDLSATYTISVYATKSGSLNSDVATATLCWIDVEPKTEGVTNSIANIPANAVLIKCKEGTLNVQGLDDGTLVSVYAIDGKQVGTAISQQGEVNVNTTLQSGSIAVVKMGEKIVKVLIR